MAAKSNNHSLFNAIVMQALMIDFATVQGGQQPLFQPFNQRPIFETQFTA
jgi:hypothetical protein